ncbi:MAG: tetratricopeptide repeat protein [Myxococcota bacterium]|nr:tetratricopeptide repeat protein [Myxococcota bacterium]
MFKILSVMTAASLASACWVPLEQGNQLERDMGELRAQLLQTRKALDYQQAELSEQMERADTQIERVAGTLEDLNRAARMTDADFGVQLQRLITEVQELRGKVELAEYTIESLNQTLHGEGGLIARVEAFEKDGKSSSRSAKTRTTRAPQRASSPTKIKELLEQGLVLGNEAKYDQARGIYRAILKKEPKKKGVSDLAYFQLGELYFQQGRYHSALQEYIKVVEKFGSGTYADDAYYKIAMCSLSVGNLEDAQIFFNELVQNHKKSPLYKQAVAKLGDVNAKLAAEKK